MAEGTRFKTGYLPAPVSYADMGRAFGERLSDSMQALADADTRKRAQLNANMGFSRAMAEATPAGLTQKYQSGAQILLEKYQDAAVKAQRTGKQEDVDAYQARRTEFNEFKNIGSAKSAMDTQTMLNIANGRISGMSGTIEENLELFQNSNQADYIWDEASGSLQVGAGGQYVNWKESNIGDLNDVYVPTMTWTGTEYMPEAVGEDIYSTLLEPKLEQLQIRDADTMFATGRVDMDAAYEMVNGELQRRIQLRGPELMEAIQAVGQKTIRTPGKPELDEKDFAEAKAYYTQAELLDTVYPDKRNLTNTAGKINKEGVWVFSITDDELAAVGSNDIIDKRKAFSLYMEQTASRAVRSIVAQDERDRIFAERQARYENQLEIDNINNQPSPYTPIEPFTGTHLVKGTGAEGEVKGDVPKIKATLNGRSYKFKISGEAIKKTIDNQGNEVKSGDEEKLSGAIQVEVENLVFHPETGKLIGFDLDTGPGILDGVLLDLAGTPIKSFFVGELDPAFEEVRTSIMQIQAPSKNKRSGAQFLNDAEIEGYFSVGQEPPSEEALDRANNFFSAMQSISVNQGMEAMGAIGDIVVDLPIREKIAMEQRIFEEVSKGNYPTVIDGEVVFQD
jgi:hypothetical protein